jgi:hypothetical protein
MCSYRRRLATSATSRAHLRVILSFCVKFTFHDVRPGLQVSFVIGKNACCRACPDDLAAGYELFLFSFVLA